MLYDEIINDFKDLQNIEASLSLLNWDQSVYMPKNGIGSRAEVIGTLSRIAHEKITDDSFYNKIEGFVNSNEFVTLKDIEKSEITKIRKEVMKERKIPVRLSEELAKTTTLATSFWEDAKRNNNDREFLPLLKKIFELKREYSNHIGFDNDPYDAMLSDFDEGLRYSYIKPLFENLEKELTSLINKIPEIEFNPLEGKYFDKNNQWDFGINILRKMGLDFSSSRQDFSVHPFTTRIGVNDVRITTDITENDLSKGLFSTIHEGGHCLYELEVSKNFNDSPLSNIESLSLHESQSRFYENIIGRSYSFWKSFYPQLRKIFKEQLKNIDLDNFYRIINRVVKSPIRIEADEVTYNLHIILRTDIEHGIINNQLNLSDIEEKWNEKTKEIFGFYPASKSQGYLQDVHWSCGLFGYFPTYTIGNIISAQFFNTITKEIGKTDNMNDEYFIKILSWFKKNLYSKGNIYSANETVRLITGEDIRSDYFINYLKEKYIIA